MNLRDVPGFLEFKNELNIARWRMRLALTQGKDLQDLRPDGQLVLVRGHVLSGPHAPRDWSEFDSPAIKRKRANGLPGLLRRQVA